MLCTEPSERCLNTTLIKGLTDNWLATLLLLVPCTEPGERWIYTALIKQLTDS
jgi:hypothetical protein